MKKRKVIASILLLALMGTGCGDKKPTIQENGEIHGVELEEASEESVSLPIYDINTIEESTENITFVKTESKYKEQLDDRCLYVYSEIKTGYESFKKDVLISKTITPEELFKIMSIINIDDPEIIQAQTKYGYSLDENGYVYKVILYYTMNESDYVSAMARIENNLLGFYSTLLKANNFEDVATAVIPQHKAINYYKAQFFGDSTEDSTIDIVKQTSKNNSVVSYLNDEKSTQAIAKYTALCLRYLGLECYTTIGKLTNNQYEDLITKGSNQIESIDDVKKVTTKKDNTFTVNYNFNDYVAWNIVKINDEWYNLDLALSNQIILEYPQRLGVMQPLALYLVNDRTTAMTRISYYAEDILGVSPVCTSIQFQDFYRNDNYLLTHNETQMLSMLTSKISVLNSQGTEKLSFQFEDEETLNLFIDNFDSLINLYNSENINQILTYKVTDIREALIVVVDGFTYK